MKTSMVGLDLIRSFEGCRLYAYKCPAGVWTIGYGHTKGVKMGQTITSVEAIQLLKSDLAVYEERVMRYKGYDWSQNEFDALVSFAFNIGSIDQLTRNGSRTKAEIAAHWCAYNKAGGKVLAGLTRRREAERALFMKGWECMEVRDTEVLVNGKKVVVKGVNVEGSNYVRLRDLERLVPVVVGYDGGYATIDTKREGNVQSEDLRRYDYVYTQTKGNVKHKMRVWEVPPKRLRAMVVKGNLNEVKERYVVNAGFFWWEDSARKKPYSLSILVSEGKVLANALPHGKACGCLLVYGDGHVEVKAVKDITQEKDVVFAVGGYTSLPKVENVAEGFSGVYADVIRETSRVVLGYHAGKDRVMVVGYGKMSAARARDVLKELGCQKGICIDAGGSALMKEGETYYLKSDGRNQFGCVYVE